MDYDKLIEHLRECGTYGFKQEECRDAAIAIETLRADLARVTAERDGAIEDLEEIMFKGGHNIDTCHFCANGQCYGRGGTQVCNPLWCRTASTPSAASTARAREATTGLDLREDKEEQCASGNMMCGTS